MKMRYREQKYICGNYLDVNMFPVFPAPVRSGRKAKRKPSSNVQKVLNKHNSEKALLRIINANFSNNDVKLELTYSEQNHPTDIQQAKKDIVNFFRRIKRARVKADLPELKYIYSLEQGSKKKRIHFHLIMSGGLDITQISKIWGKGYVDKCLPLMFTQTGCPGIAKYFCKQQVIDDNSQTVKRWVASHSCVKPEPKNNDFKLTKKRVREFAEYPDDGKLFEKLYPDYYFAECKPFYNDDLGLWYLYLRMYRKDAEIDV